MCPSLSISFYTKKKKKAYPYHYKSQTPHSFTLCLIVTREKKYPFHLLGMKLAICHGKHPYFLFKKKSIFSLAKRLKKWGE